MVRRKNWQETRSLCLMALLDQILRVAARNSAGFEWLHHAHVGVDAGLTNEQLTIIRDVNTPLPHPSAPAPLSAIQAAALRFAEASTFSVVVPKKILDEFKAYLTDDQQLLEAAAVPATYNMVSRLLVALDVGELGEKLLPLPETHQEEHQVDVGDGVKLFVKTAKRITDGDSAPWLVFINSLMSNEKMWDGVMPRLSKKYNILTYDQRGHGQVSARTAFDLVCCWANLGMIVVCSCHASNPSSARSRYRDDSVDSADPNSHSCRHWSVTWRCHSAHSRSNSPCSLLAPGRLRHSSYGTRSKSCTVGREDCIGQDWRDGGSGQGNLTPLVPCAE